MKRRTFILGTLAAGAGGLLLARPNNAAAPYSPYFERLNAQLLSAQTQQGVSAVPAMLIDAKRLKANALTVKAELDKAHMPLRLVVKSLPSLPVLDMLMHTLHTQRLMVFHQPFINLIAQHFPQSDLLLGKPMPVAAARAFYLELNKASSNHTNTVKHPDSQQSGEQNNQPNGLAYGSSQAAFDPKTQLQWLIDSEQRLKEYLKLAQSLGTKMRINIEIDVGLHRGGLGHADALDALIDIIKQNPDHLSFAGFMGYDAHVGSIPSIIESRKTSLGKVCEIYNSFIARAYALLPTAKNQNLCFNGAGSPTFLYHTADKHSPLTEVSAGSCFVKPTDFDLPILSALKPALFIATPVLKSWSGLQLPGSDMLSSAWATYNPNKRHTFFVYGGNWMAEPVAPTGLSKNTLYGKSSNQEMYNAADDAGLHLGDHIFFRPTQSEAVMLEFEQMFWVQDDKLEPLAHF